MSEVDEKQASFHGVMRAAAAVPQVDGGERRRRGEEAPLIKLNQTSVVPFPDVFSESILFLRIRGDPPFPASSSQSN
jgi:hypothetical protein